MPRHSQEAIDQGLVALAFHRSSDRASEATGIPASTLRNWTTEHADKLERIQAQLQPVFAARWEAVAHNLTEIQLRASAQVLANIHHLLPQDAAKVIQQTGVAAGIATDKSQLLRDKPTAITETRNVDEIIRKLSASQVVDSTAIELTTPPRSLTAVSSRD